MIAALRKALAPLSLAEKLFALVLVMLCSTQLAHAERKTTYYHTDGLGSVVAASDQTGALLWLKEYAPFGEQRDSTAENEKLAYTGKEHDDVTGLTYFGARYYDPQLGRFMSVDPVGFVESNPMSFNRYAYVNNNPYKNVDPDGREAVGAEWQQRTRAFFGAMPAPRNKIERGLELAGVALPFAAAATPLVADLAIAAFANPTTALAITEGAIASEALGGGTLIVGGAAIAAAKAGGQLLYRYRNGTETATRLAKGAADAEAKIGVHGVSVTTSPAAGRACGVACRDVVEQVFPVVKTGADPNHYTVVMPKPVTKEVANQFNDLFRDAQ